MAGRRWTETEVKTLRDLYPCTPTYVIAEKLGRTDRQIYMKALSMGLRKSAEYLASPAAGRIRPGSNLGGATQFKPGHKPWNHGMKGWQPDNANTRFKPGQRRGAAAEHLRPIGYERLSKDGYLERKVSDTGHKPTDWRKVHHLVWEKHHGLIPDGYIVVFRDRDKMRIAIDNLELITREENMARNTVHRLPKELALAVQLKGALQRQINKRTRQHEEQD